MSKYFEEMEERSKLAIFKNWMEGFRQNGMEDLYKEVALAAIYTTTANEKIQCMITAMDKIVDEGVAKYKQMIEANKKIGVDVYNVSDKDEVMGAMSRMSEAANAMRNLIQVHKREYPTL